MLSENINKKKYLEKLLVALEEKTQYISCEGS